MNLLIRDGRGRRGGTPKREVQLSLTNVSNLLITPSAFMIYQTLLGITIMGHGPC